MTTIEFLREAQSKIYFLVNFIHLQIKLNVHIITCYSKDMNNSIFELLYSLHNMNKFNQFYISY